MKKKKIQKSRRAKFINKGPMRAEIYIYDDIGEDFFGGGIGARGFAEDLKAIGAVKELDVFINSFGGNVFEGLTIYNQLVRHDATVNVYIDGMAASIASVVSMAGDHISIAENAMMMIHKPSGGGIGTANDLRSLADVLDQIQGQLIKTFTRRSGRKEGEILSLMEDKNGQDVEAWLTADQAMGLGLVDAITEAKEMAAYADLTKYNYKNTPQSFPSAIYTVKPEAPLRTKYMDKIKHQAQLIKLKRG